MPDQSSDLAPNILQKRVVRKIAPSFRVYRDGTFLRNFKLNKTEFAIGSHPQCDILLEGREVSERHCLLRVAQGRGIFLVPGQGPHPTRLNGQALTEEAKLAHGDRIEIGSYSIAVSLRIREETSEEVQVPRLSLPQKVLRKLQEPAAAHPAAAEPPPEATEYAPAEAEAASGVEEKTIVDLAETLEKPRPTPPPDLDDILAPLEEEAAQAATSAASFAVPFDESMARRLPAADLLEEPEKPPPIPSGAEATTRPEEGPSFLTPLPPPSGTSPAVDTSAADQPPPTSYSTVETQPRGPAARVPQTVQSLIFVNTERQGEALEISRPETLIGRRFGDILINDSTVSKRHLLVERLPGQGLRIRDLGSSNGTYVNGRRVEECLLVPGDKLELGRVMLQFLQKEVGQPAEKPGLQFEETELLAKREARAAAEPPGRLSSISLPPEPEWKEPSLSPELAAMAEEALPLEAAPPLRRGAAKPWPWKRLAQGVSAVALLALLLMLLFFSPLNRLLGLKREEPREIAPDTAPPQTIITDQHAPAAQLPTPLPTPLAAPLVTPPPGSTPLAPSAPPAAAPAPDQRQRPLTPDAAPRRRAGEPAAAAIKETPAPPPETPRRKARERPASTRKERLSRAIPTPLPERTAIVPPPAPLPKTELEPADDLLVFSDSGKKPIPGSQIQPLPRATSRAELTPPAATPVAVSTPRPLPIPTPRPTPTPTPPAIAALDNALKSGKGDKQLLRGDFDKASDKLKNNDRKAEVKVAKAITVDDINRSLDIEVSLPMLTEEKIKFGPLPVEDFRKQLKTRIRVANVCYLEELQRDARASGKVTVSFIVKAGGQLAGASIVRSAISSPALLQCLKEKINSIRLTAGPGEDLNVFYNFKFKGAPQLIDFNNPA